ncbi:MAG TPA: hypothetical protein VGO91_18725 [Pyrinomonadaceae bacterium]|nr:hypothetical protein [Pyrinomonadaceae bacterium]
MSEDITKDISSEYNTAPTIETVLERIEALSQEMRAGFAITDQRLTALEERFDKFDVRLVRIESEVKSTHSEMFTLRADFKEFKSQFKEPA